MEKVTATCGCAYDVYGFDEIPKAEDVGHDGPHSAYQLAATRGLTGLSTRSRAWLVEPCADHRKPEYRKPDES